VAQSDFFLKLDGIEGESADDKHKGEIDLLSWSWGETNAGSMAHGGGGGSGRVAVQDFHFVMRLQKASPKLMQACASGQHIGNAELACRKAGGKQEDYLKIKFGDVMCSSYQAGGSNGSPDLNDQVSLNFSKIEFEYKEQKADGTLGGSVKAGWDVKKNVKT
jgi:type VI secretion system secreted protein Hcp